MNSQFSYSIPHYIKMLKKINEGKVISDSRFSIDTELESIKYEDKNISIEFD